MPAEFRSVQTRMWREDEWFQELPTDARLLFIYLFTNPSADVSGIYRLPFRTLIFESGIDAVRAQEILDRFAHDGKAFYEDGVVWVVKMRENQLSSLKLSPTVKTHIDNEVAKIPNCRVKALYMKQYGYPIEEPTYPIDTLSIPYGSTYTNTNTNTPTTTTPPIPPNGAVEWALPASFSTPEEEAAYRQAVATWEGLGIFLNTTIEEDMKEAVITWAKRGHPEYVVDAIKVAARNQVRKWSYVAGVLKKCEDSGNSPNGAAPGKPIAGQAAMSSGVVGGFTLGDLDQ